MIVANANEAFVLEYKNLDGSNVMRLFNDEHQADKEFKRIIGALCEVCGYSAKIHNTIFTDANKEVCVEDSNTRDQHRVSLKTKAFEGVNK